MPPLVYETVAWLRYYTSLPFPLLPGEAEANVNADPAKNAHATPLAGALIGMAGALVLLLAYALRMPAFAAAAVVLIVLAIVTGAMAHRALVVAGDKLGISGKGAALAYPGLVILIASIVIHLGALYGLAQQGVLKAAVALIAAAAVSRATAVSFALNSTRETAEPTDSSSLQKLVLVALALGIALTLPVYGLGSAVAGMAAAIAAAAIVSAYAPRVADGGGRELSGPVEIAAEIAFLIAVYIFATV